MPRFDEAVRDAVLRAGPDHELVVVLQPDPSLALRTVDIERVAVGEPVRLRARVPEIPSDRR